MKAAPQDSSETLNMDSQTTHHVGLISPNLPGPAVLFSSRKPQKGKKKAHKIHHTPDFQQLVELAPTFHPSLPPIHWKKRFSDIENATRITEINHNTAIKNQQKPITSLITQTFYQSQIIHIHPLAKKSTPKLLNQTVTEKRGIVLERFCLNAEISVMMTNHQNPSNAQRDFKNNKPQTLREKVEIGLTLKKRLHLNTPPPALSAILFQTLKRHFLKFKARMHVGMRMIVKTTNQQIAHQLSKKPAKASRYTSRK